MRYCGFALGLLLVVSANFVPAQDADKTRAVIDKALKAMGGEAKLEKFKAQTWKEKGTYYGMGDGLPYTGTYAIQWPYQFKMEITDVFTTVLNGDKGWIKSMGETMEMTKEQVAEQRENQYAGWVTTLAPLKDKAYQLSLLKESKVGDRPAVGIKVAHKDHRDVSLFFDKESGLLIKSEFRTKSQEQGGKEVLQEMYYSDYKEVEGIKIPSKIKILRDGKKFVEAENTDIKPMGKLPDSVFGKP
ncbi:MAG: hypothetical protein AB7K24_10410 [Gemmataceae bacterium]